MLAILVMGLVLRLDGLATRGLRLNEAFSWRMSQFSFSEIIARSADDFHPPLYFLLLKIWTAACGDSLIAMRLLSVLFGLAAIGAMYALMTQVEVTLSARSVDGPRSRLFAPCLMALLVATSPFQIRWSTEIRMYSLGSALAAC